MSTVNFTFFDIFLLRLFTSIPKSQCCQRFAGILPRTECPHFSVFIHLRRISADQGVIAHQQKRDLRAADGLRRIPDALFFSDEPVVPRPGHGIPAALRHFGRIGVVVERAGDCGLTSKTVEHDDRLLAGQKAAGVKRPAVAAHEALADHPLDIFVIPFVAREVAELRILLRRACRRQNGT